MPAHFYVVQMNTSVMHKTFLVVFVVYALSTLIALVVIIGRFGGGDNNNNNNDNNGNGNGNGNEERWWEGPDAEERGQLLWAGLWTIVVLLCLCVTAFRTFRTPTSYRLGFFGGSMSMFSSLLLIICFYFCSFEQQEQQNNQNRHLQNNNNNNYNYNNDQQQYEDEEGRGQRVLSTFALVASVFYALLAGFTIWSSRNIAQSHGMVDLDRKQSSGHVDVLHDAWRYLSTFSICGIVTSFLIGLVSLFTEEADRMREEGLVFNFLLIVAWILLVFIGVMVVGKRVFKRDPTISQVEVGFFNGSLYYVCGVTLVIAGLYGGFSLEGLGEGRRRAAEGPMGSLFFAFLCFAFSITYLSYASLVAKYQLSVLRANKDSIMSDYNDIDREGETSYGVEFAGGVSGLWNQTKSDEGSAVAGLSKNDGAVVPV